jgi:hypothetical protein
MRARSWRLLAIMGISVASTLGARGAHAAEPGGRVATALPSGTPVTEPPAAASSEPLEEEVDEEELVAPVAPKPPTRHAERRWYGWQTLLADTASVTFLFATAQSLDGYSLVPYLALGPTIHFAHGNVAMGALSLGTRVVLPLGGAFTGAFLGTATGACDHGGSSDDEGYGELGCVLGSGAIGFLLGVTSAVIIDASVLAYDRDAKSAPPSRATLRVAPTVAYDGRKATVALAGSF